MKEASGEQGFYRPKSCPYGEVLGFRSPSEVWPGRKGGVQASPDMTFRMHPFVKPRLTKAVTTESYAEISWVAGRAGL
ncbi:MAG TPA: hypothetical protein VHT01_00555 [Candidatus Udaeobacter sp.]|nr:hypothetical protein [Candidatus Udaeobacter sp.]